MSDINLLHQFDPGTVQSLRAEMAPLMRSVNIRGNTEARKFDLLVARLQLEQLRASSRFDDLKVELLDRVNDLQGNLNPVREKAEVIRAVSQSSWWDDVTCSKLEELRTELRDIAHHRRTRTGPGTTSRVIDVADSGVQTSTRGSSVPAVDNALYRQQVEEVLTRHFDNDPVLQKIRRGEPVAEKELEQLASAAANGVFIGAINRIGTEEPWASQMGEFYGSSYIVNPRGQIEAQASYGDDELLVHEIDMDMIREVRDTWQFFRDRRPETYQPLVEG